MGKMSENRRVGDFLTHIVGRTEKTSHLHEVPEFE